MADTPKPSTPQRAADRAAGGTAGAGPRMSAHGQVPAHDPAAKVATVAADPAVRRKPPGSGSRWRATLLAVLIHGLLLGLLMIGVTWQTQKPVAVQAELWTPPPPKPQPVVPRPEPVPEPPPPPPEPKVEQPPVVKPDIALEKAREEKERKAREEAAEKRRLEQEARKAAEARKLADAKNAEQERQEKAEKAEKAEKEKAAEAKKAADAKKLADAKAKQEAQEEDKRREKYLQGLIDKAGAPAGAAVGASAGGNRGAADGKWAAKVASAIAANTVFTRVDVPGNPRTHFTVTTLPDCTVTSIKMTRSSGIADWDQAAERAIQRTSPFPLPPGGKCDGPYQLTQGPKDER